MKSGFVALAGKPNVGKSTFINAVFGRKVVIVSDKPQTTRNRINCIYTDKDSQIIFVDTPGIHKPLHRLGEYMVKAAVQALKGVDLILFMLDAADGFTKTDEHVAKIVNEAGTKTILVVNKIDVSGEEKAKAVGELAKSLVENVVSVHYISALKGIGVSDVLEKIKEELPEGPQYYPEDMITDRPLSFMAAEIIREKIFHLTRQEVPHSTAVVIEEVKDRPNGVLYIRATIYVERESQKGILIGKNGSMIKKIGTLAREEIEFLVGRRVFLDLNVKVKEKWREKDFIILQEIGLKHDIK
ncbi:GTPase Era [Thermotoga sp. KOL6]|uniref:GTPase Era n=1 Tax=Thermotoga sp. KOL6 TaxID=126741 RepID=UPI000CC1881F|nr:GTPase Era [Thermotoga sp. KOL6]PLV58400.1 GTPase Era [Thermotoga sp. KOL6]